MLTHNNIDKVYSGKPGCMCGCNGNYSKSDKAKKSALTRMLKTNYKVQMFSKSHDNLGCLYFDNERGTRTNAIYLKKDAVLTEDMKARIINN